MQFENSNFYYHIWNKHAKIIQMSTNMPSICLDKWSLELDTFWRKPFENIIFLKNVPHNIISPLSLSHIAGLVFV